MQSKSTFPARIAPFSVPLGRMEAVQGLRKARFKGLRKGAIRAGNVDLLCIAVSLIYFLDGFGAGINHCMPYV